MTEEQRSECHKIIHSMAIAAGAGNAVPVPGLGIAADIATMTTMSIQLSKIFGSSISDSVAESMAKSALGTALKKAPGKVIAKELSKFIPGLGSIVAPAISVGLLEAAGWEMAYRLDNANK